MRLSRKDIFFLSLRITITLSLIYYLGLIYGILLIWSFYTVTFYAMKWIFGLEALEPTDTLLNHDDDKNVANIVSKCIFYSNQFTQVRSFLKNTNLNSLFSRSIQKQSSYSEQELNWSKSWANTIIRGWILMNSSISFPSFVRYRTAFTMSNNLQTFSQRSSVSVTHMIKCSTSSFLSLITPRTNLFLCLNATNALLMAQV